MDKIHNWKEIEDIIKDQQFQFARLQTLDGDNIVAYNSPNQAKRTVLTLTEKLAEIKRRLKALEPGVYIVELRSRFAGKEPSYKYYIGNKNFDPNAINKLSENPDGGLKVAPKPQQQKNENSMLSVEKAIDYVQQNAQLKADNEYLKKENAELKQKVLELESELDSIDADDDLADEQPDGISKLAEFGDKHAPALVALMDRFLDLREKRIDLEAKKIGLNTTPAAVNKKDFNNHIPTPEMPEYPEYLEWLESLPDRTFERHLNKVKEVSEQMYATLCDEFGVVEEDEEEEEQTNNN